MSGCSRPAGSFSDHPGILTIAGSDSGGGAGIQQDGRVFTVLGAYGCSAVTAVTVQNSLGVHCVEAMPASLVREQIEAVLSDIRPLAAKTGMLARADIVEAVADALDAFEERPLLAVDPVMVSKNGHRLLSEDAVEVLRTRLLPLATVVTPNLPEAETLLGRPIRSLDAMREAAVDLVTRLNGPSVVLTGGHLEARESVDVLADREGVEVLRGGRIMTRHTHGTGCAFSAALTVFLARGLAIRDAAAKAKEFVEMAIFTAGPVGEGTGPVNCLGVLEFELARYPVLKALDEGWKLLSGRPSRPLVPEIQINLGYALPFARTTNDVAAFPGRIVGLKNGVARVGCPEFGASSHVARIILTVMKYDATFRSAMNIRCDSGYIEKADAMGYSVAEFSRKDEPERIRLKEGSTLVWGVREAIERMGGHVPDIIYDRGDVGKEPIIRVIGRDPVDVVQKALKVADIDNQN